MRRSGEHDNDWQDHQAPLEDQRQGQHDDEQEAWQEDQRQGQHNDEQEAWQGDQRQGEQQRRWNDDEATWRAQSAALREAAAFFGFRFVDGRWVVAPGDQRQGEQQRRWNDDDQATWHALQSAALTEAAAFFGFRFVDGRWVNAHAPEPDHSRNEHEV
jgi:hypothetical protein